MAGPLKNSRHEKFAQELFKGSTADGAYASAGYKPDRGAASRLSAKVNIRERVAELHEEAAQLAKVDAAYVLRQAVKLHEKCLNENENNTAARALELIGKHKSVQAFKEFIEHSGRIEYANISDEELEARIAAHEKADASRPTQH